MPRSFTKGEAKFSESPQLYRERKSSDSENFRRTARVDGGEKITEQSYLLHGKITGTLIILRADKLNGQPETFRINKSAGWCNGARTVHYPERSVVRVLAWFLSNK